jgi:hypothetical protein
MKKRVLVLGFLVIILLAFSLFLSGCGDGASDETGSLALKGLAPEFNGQFVIVRTSSMTPPKDGSYLFGSTNSLAFEGVEVRKGNVTIPIHLSGHDKNGHPAVFSYFGNDKDLNISLHRKSTKSFTDDEVSAGTYMYLLIEDVDFTNGKSTVTFGTE